MTRAKKEEIKYSMKLQGLYARLNHHIHELLRVQAALKSVGDVDESEIDANSKVNTDGFLNTLSDQLYLRLIEGMILSSIEKVNAEIENL